MDWKTTVDQLMKIEQIPQDTLKTKKAAAAKVQSAFDALKTNFTSLKTAAFGLQSGLTGFPRSASVLAGNASTSVSGASVTTDSGATIGNFAFNVTSMGRASTFTGNSLPLATPPAPSMRPSVTAATGLTLNDYGVTAGGTFTVNGQTVTISSGDLGTSASTFFSSLGLTTAIDSNGLLSLTASGAGASIGSAGDTSNILSAIGMGYDAAASAAATPDVVFSQTFPTGVLANLTLADLKDGASLTGNGTLTINGATLGTTFTSASTLASVISAINSNSATGVSASIDAVKGRMVLTSNSIGSSGISVSAGGGLDSVLGLNSAQARFVRGTGVTYDLSLNSVSVGTGLTSDTTTIDLSKFGYGSTKFTVAAEGLYNVQVTGSGSAFKSKINTFISSYNTLRQTLDDATKITVGSDGSISTSVLSGRSDVNNLLSSIRSKMYTSVSGSSINASYDNISKIGLGFDSSGVLSITDSAKLDSALANSPSSVEALLNANKSASPLTTPNSEQGVATRIYNLMTSLTGTKGLIASATTSLTSQSTRLQSQIDSLTRSLALTRKTLEASFIAMEKAQSKYQSMTQQITSAFSNK